MITESGKRMGHDRYSRLAAEHLGDDTARRWTALLRPCVRLRHAADGDPVAASLGGTPSLPPGTPWPEWPGQGPLSFVASVDCAALPHEALPEEFPRDGTLLFFFYGGDPEDDAFVSADDPETWAGAQVHHIPADTPVTEAAPPPSVAPYPEVPLTATPEESAPDLTLPASAEALLGAPGPWPHPRDTPRELRPFVRAFTGLRTSMGHQLAGHPVPLQGPVEHDPAPTGEPWLLLAQFDSDSGAEMSWFDEGTLYWLIHPKDLAARRFDRIAFTGQC
ncbi:YwqG family protein [Streptomyces sp. 4F14]|uniref:YwqG family protein n=1 Tax=Streptomyces sp. 4F14 TaxID=3394380 RepID=UPI003A895926